MINKDNIAAFRAAYDTCEGDDQAVFIFEGHEVLKGYAKYLLEYWDMVHGGAA